MTEDPVEASLRRAAAAVVPADRDAFLRNMRAGLATFDDAVGPADRVIEVEAALASVAPEDLRAAAGRFAARRQAFVLGRRSWDLLRSLAAGDDVEAAAAALLDQILEAVEAEDDDEVRRQLGDYATECRFVLSGGTGPNSLRGAKLV